MRGPPVRFLARSLISFFSRRAYISRDLSTLGGTKGAQTHTFSRKYDGAGDALWRGGVVQDRGSLERGLKGNYSVYRYDVLPDRVILYIWPNAGGSEFTFQFPAAVRYDSGERPVCAV